MLRSLLLALFVSFEFNSSFTAAQPSHRWSSRRQTLACDATILVLTMVPQSKVIGKRQVGGAQAGLALVVCGEACWRAAADCRGPPRTVADSRRPYCHATVDHRGLRQTCADCHKPPRTTMDYRTDG
mmetsp:Transcript_39919/g.78956  ORF Transcript_39919/g.78956 Transcript_39919/m.78956 type:complete len:127 (+) Transcript_39919:341-721(+)